MRYVDAGYTIVLSILFLYGVFLVLRRRKLTRQLERVESIRRDVPGAPADDPGPGDPGPGTAPDDPRPGAAPEAAVLAPLSADGDRR